MPENYVAAANRHFDSADVLFGQGRRIEASQLYAYACECALKAILDKQSIPFKRVHINDHLAQPPVGKAPKADLVSTYQSAQQGRSGSAYPLASSSIFNGWTVRERYDDGSAVRPHLASHRNDANDIRRVFHTAFAQGLLP